MPTPGFLNQHLGWNTVSVDSSAITNDIVKIKGSIVTVKAIVITDV